MNRKNETVRSVVLGTVRRQPLLCTALVLAVAGAVAASLLPPLVLGRVVDRLTARQVVPFALALGYFGLLALSGGLDSLRESLLTVFGQKMTHALRSAMCAKLDKLPAEAFVNQESGAAVSRFVGDVDTVEELFTSGIISMFADACRLCGILAVIFAENRGLALILLVVLPLLYLFTRVVQKRMLKAQLQNRAAVARASAHVPETLRCIRTIHTLRRENYMEKAYDEALDDSFAAVEKTNFYDACYSPVILIMNAAVVALVMLLSAAGSSEVRAFFGMSVGTAVAVIAYISQVFTPLENIGMEIETIQSAVAGVRRINGFLAQAERIPTAETAPQAVPGAPSVELQNVHFGYESDEEVLHDLSFAVQKGEQVTLTGRTGAGKSTIFKLLLGLYRPQQGKVMLNGVEAATLPDTARRPLVGYVEQSFRRVPGTVRDQITLFDAAITPQQAEDAARTVGLHDAIAALPEGYDTPCTPGIFSQGQWQLLSIARAIAAGPQILLLDEITAKENIGMEIETIQSAVAGVRRINGFLAQAERIPTAETAPQAVPGAPSVELQNVHFGYESDEEVLHDLSFAVQKGEQVTLTGRTGAGKSTIFKLLLGLYRPQQGKVMLNGVEAATLPDTARRPLVGYVEQSFRRVPGTVRDQITLFDAAITPQQAEDAARTVGLHDAIAALPEGYDTPCTPGIFSQGQWQLLSIARAIAAGPQILLLDEITANLDAGTEQTVLDALQRAGQNRTVVSISHRLYNRTGGRSIEI